MGTADATVLWESNTAVAGKLTRFDLTNRRFDQTPELTALFFGNRGLQVLDLRPLLSHEHDHCDIGNTTDPGITNELGIQRQQTKGLFSVATRRGLPVNQVVLAVERADRVDVGDEIVVTRALLTKSSMRPPSGILMGTCRQRRCMNTDAPIGSNVSNSPPLSP